MRSRKREDERSFVVECPSVCLSQACLGKLNPNQLNKKLIQKINRIFSPGRHGDVVVEVSMSNEQLALELVSDCAVRLLGVLCTHRPAHPLRQNEPVSLFILPRQARDKYRENSKKRCRFPYLLIPEALVHPVVMVSSRRHRHFIELRVLQYRVGRGIAPRTVAPNANPLRVHVDCGMMCGSYRTNRTRMVVHT
jgi:hypothetical protein